MLPSAHAAISRTPASASRASTPPNASIASRASSCSECPRGDAAHAWRVVLPQYANERGNRARRFHVTDSRDRGFPDFLGIIAEEIHQRRQCPAILNATERPRRIGPNIDDGVAQRANQRIDARSVARRDRVQGLLRFAGSHPSHSTGSPAPHRRPQLFCVPISTNSHLANARVVGRQSCQQPLNIGSRKPIVVEIVSRESRDGRQRSRRRIAPAAPSPASHRTRRERADHWRRAASSGEKGDNIHPPTTPALIDILSAYISSARGDDRHSAD